jgi:hypothetical protein
MQHGTRSNHKREYRRIKGYRVIRNTYAAR